MLPSAPRGRLAGGLLRAVWGLASRREAHGEAARLLGETLAVSHSEETIRG